MPLNQVLPMPLRFSAWSLPNSVTPYVATNKYALVVELQYVTNITRTTHIKQFMPSMFRSVCLHPPYKLPIPNPI